MDTATASARSFRIIRSDAPRALSVAAATRDAEAAADVAAVLELVGRAGVEVQSADGAPPLPSDARALLAGPGASGPERTAAITGLPGVLRGLAPRVDCRVVAVDPDRSPEAASALLLRFCRAARALGVQRILLALDRDGETAVDAALTRAIAAEAGAVELLERCRPGAVTELLIERAPMPTLLVVRPEEAGLLSGVLHAITGTRPIATERVRIGDTVAHLDLSSAGAEHPHALLRAACGLLLEQGFRGAAQRLRDAWLCALEDGLSTSGLPVLAPYGRRLGAAEFLAAVAERLERRPRHASCADLLWPEIPVNVCERPRLRLV